MNLEIMNGNYFDDNSTRIQNLLNEVLQHIKKVDNRLERLKSKPPITNVDKSEYLHINDLCQLFGVHRNTIYRYIENGMLPYSKIGRQIIFLKKDIDAIIEQNYIERSE